MKPSWRVLGLLIGLGGLWLGGCGVPRTAVWLPDSSAVLYPTDDGGIALFDLEENESQLVLPRHAAWSAAPAVSPSGEQFALVEVVAAERTDTVRVFLHDLLGRERRKTAAVAWTADNRQSLGHRPTAALWSRDGQSLLFWYVAAAGDRLRVGKFDLESESAMPYENTVPLVDLWHFGLSPVRDDGRGYLAVRGRQDALTNVFFVDERDWQQRLVANVQLEDFQIQTRLIPGLPEMNDRLPIATTGWDRGALDLILGNGRLLVDTQQATMQFRFDRQLAKVRPPLVRERIVGWWPIGRGPFVLQGRLVPDATPPQILLEVAEGPGGRSRLLGPAALAPQRFAPLMPAPDGRHVLVTAAGQLGTVWSHIIDEQGQTVRRFQVSGPGWRDTLVPVRPRQPQRDNRVAVESPTFPLPAR